IDDLIGALPDRREISRDGVVIEHLGVVPAGHHVVHAPPIEIDANWPFEIVDEGVRLLVGRGPLEVTRLVRSVAVKCRDCQIDQFGHFSLLCARWPQFGLTSKHWITSSAPVSRFRKAGRPNSAKNPFRHVCGNTGQGHWTMATQY